MDKKQITVALDALGVEYKGSLGKEKLLALLSDNMPIDEADLLATALSRGLETTGDKAELIDLMGVVIVEEDEGVRVGIAEPEPEKHTGEKIEVLCIVENVHLGNGDILRFKDRKGLPESLATFLAEREQVEII